MIIPVLVNACRGPRLRRWTRIGESAYGVAEDEPGDPTHGAHSKYTTQLGAMSDLSVAQRIRELIVDGSLPPGARVAEAAIAERLGVSRTPVRNVIPALAAEGLLEPVGRRGYAVRSFSVEDSYRATELRCVLEGLAVHRLAAAGASRQVIADLRNCLNDGDAIFVKGHLADDDAEAYARVNRRFHGIMVAAAADALLTDLIQRVYGVPFVAPDVVAFNNISREEMFAILRSGQHQHHAIVDAIEAGQADLAERLMRGHSSPARKSLGIDRTELPVPV